MESHVGVLTLAYAVPAHEHDMHGYIKVTSKKVIIRRPHVLAMAQFI